MSSKSSWNSGSGKTKSTPPARNTTPEIYVTQVVDDYLQEVCDQVDAEVGGLGYIKRASPESNVWVVDDVFLLPQEVSHGSVDFKPGAMGMAVEWAFEEGRLDDLRFSWHTHYNFSTFWSGTDEAAIATYLRQAPYLFSLVLNKSGDRLARLDVPNVPVIGQVKFDNLNYKVIKADRTEGRAAEHIAEHVEVYRWTSVQKQKGLDKKDKKPKASEVKQPTDARSYQQKMKREREEREAGRVAKGKELDKPLSGDEAREFLAAEVEEVHGELITPEEWRAVLDKAKNGAYVQLTSGEWDDLEAAGFNPVNMSDEAIDDALVQLRLAEAGLIDPESVGDPEADAELIISGGDEDEHSSPLDTEYS